MTPICVQSSVAQLMSLVANEPVPQSKFHHEGRDVGNTSTID